MEDEVGEERLLERRGEALDELVRQPADEADRVGHQIPPPVVLEPPRRRVERLEERSSTEMSASVSAFSSVDLPAFV